MDDFQISVLKSELTRSGFGGIIQLSENATTNSGFNLTTRSHDHNLINSLWFLLHWFPLWVRPVTCHSWRDPCKGRWGFFILGFSVEAQITWIIRSKPSFWHKRNNNEERIQLFSPLWSVISCRVVNGLGETVLLGFCPTQSLPLLRTKAVNTHC